MNHKIRTSLCSKLLFLLASLFPWPSGLSGTAFSFRETTPLCGQTMSFTLAIRQDMPTHLQRSPISVAWFAKVNEENEENALSSLLNTFDCTSCNIFRSAQKLHHAQSMKNPLANDSSMFNSKVIAAKDLSSVEARQVMVNSTKNCWALQIVLCAHLCRLTLLKPTHIFDLIHLDHSSPFSILVNSSSLWSFCRPWGGGPSGKPAAWRWCWSDIALPSIRSRCNPPRTAHCLATCRGEGSDTLRHAVTLWICGDKGALRSAQAFQVVLFLSFSRF